MRHAQPHLPLILWVTFVGMPAAPATLARDNSEIDESMSTEIRGTTIQQSYQIRIDGLITEHGPRSEGLAEAFSGLGDEMLQQGRYAEALSAFHRALGINRANLGLYSLEHQELLERLIEVNTLLGNGHELLQNLHHLFWLYRRNYGEQDPRLLPLIEKLAGRHLRSYYRRIRPLPVEHLVVADKLYEQAEHISRTTGDVALQAGVLANIAAVNFHLAAEIGDGFGMSYVQLRQVMIPHARPAPYNNETAVRDYYFKQSFYRGEMAIRQILRFHEQNLPASLPEYIRAMVLLGDYHFGLRRKFNGMRYYRLAYGIMRREQLADEFIAGIFGEPVPLDRLSVNGLEIPELLPNDSYVDAIVDISDAGWPGNIRITSSYPATDPRLRQRGEMAIAALAYRPRMVAGETVVTRDVELRFVIRE